MDRRSFPPLEDEFTRALLRSADGDEPPNAAYAKVASALGVGVGVGVSASLAPAPAVLARSVSDFAGVVRWWSSLGLRFLTIGVSGALLVASGVFLFRGHGQQPGSAAPSAAPIAQGVPSLGAQSSGLPGPAAKTAELPAPQRAPLSASLPVTHLPKPKRSVAAHSARSGSVAPTQAPGASLAEQVQSLDRARLALRSGQAGAALREIAHYRSSWPNGVFLTEASVLEIEALAARGERGLAAARATEFVAAHPDSPQAGRLRRLVSQEKP